jgi:hypothetical protein
MRHLLTILFLWVYAANATNYYVSNSGNDSNDGLTPATAWQTLSKVNASSFNAGDSILLKRGDSWNERLTLTSSGSAGNPIVIGAYGNGNKPIITGFQTVTLTNNGNIWSGVTNAVDSLNTVLVNGTIQAKGRYPNASATNGGYLTAQSGTQTSLTSSSLTGTPDYTGKECVIRTAVYVLDVAKVSSQSTSTLNFDRNLTYNNFVASGGNGFFFQNDTTFLDVQGEWCYYPSTKKVYVYSTTSPVVQVSTIDTLVYVNQNNYNTFDNLSLTGANMVAFQFDTLNHITVQNCSINYTGSIANSAQTCSYLTLSNDSIQNSLSNGVFWDKFTGSTSIDSCYGVIQNCYLKNTGLLAGMGLNGNSKYNGIDVVGHQVQIVNNRMDSVGYYGIFFRSDSSLVKNNYVTNFCLVKNDGGGIGTAAGSSYPDGLTNGTVIRGNIVLNGYYPSAGTNVDHPSACLYLDNFAKNVLVDSNFLYNGKDNAFELNQGDSNVITNNIMINGDGTVINIAGSNSVIVKGNTFKFNQLYSTSPSVYTFSRTFGTTLGDCDSNYYSRLSNEYNSLNYNNKAYNLTDWQLASGKDLHSKVTPVGILHVAPDIVYNPTNSDSTVTFSGARRSLTGVDYYGSITLKPFTGAILFTFIPPHPTNAYKHYR